MAKSVKRFVAVLVIAVFGLQTASCGLILHPERKGQKGGRIDPSIAILDGVGLLLFLIPGIVAFAVDFHYGTIYLPRGRSAEAGDDAKEAPLQAVKIEGDITPESVESAVARETGLEIDLQTAQLQLVHARSEEEILRLLNSAKAEGG